MCVVQLSEELVWELFVQSGPVGGFPLLEGQQTFVKKKTHAFTSCQSNMHLSLLLTSCMSAVNVYLPKDRVTSQHQGYGFVEFKSEEDADYVRFKPSSMLQRECFWRAVAQNTEHGAL